MFHFQWNVPSRTSLSAFACPKWFLSLTASKDSAVNLYPSWSFSNTEGNCISNVAHKRLTSPRSLSGDSPSCDHSLEDPEFSTSASSGLSLFPSVGDLGFGIAACSPAISGKVPATQGHRRLGFTPHWLPKSSQQC